MPFFLVRVKIAGSAFANAKYTEEVQAARAKGEPIKFYDSNTGNLLFEAPKGRSHSQFDKESKAHGWPSFRDEEVNWEHVRCLKNGECVSLDGTHLVSETILSHARWELMGRRSNQ